MDVFVQDSHASVRLGRARYNVKNTLHTVSWQ